MSPRAPDPSPRCDDGDRAAGRTDDPGVFRAAIRVRPGAGRTRVGGASAAPESDSGQVDGRAARPPLLVAVTARAVDGAATAAAERAVAEALGVRARQVRVVRGFTSRDKLVEVRDADPQVAQRWDALLRG